MQHDSVLGGQSKCVNKYDVFVYEYHYAFCRNINDDKLLFSTPPCCLQVLFRGADDAIFETMVMIS